MEFKDVLKFVSIMLIIIVLFLPDYGNAWKWFLFVGIFLLVIWSISTDKFVLSLQMGGVVIVGIILFGSRQFNWDLLLVLGIALVVVLLAKKYCGGFVKVW